MSRSSKGCRKGKRSFRADTRRSIANWRMARRSSWIIPKAIKKRASREPHQAKSYFPSVPDGDRDDLRIARCVAGNRSGRVRRDYGTVRFWQIDDDEPDRLPGHADVRLIRVEWHERQRNG